MGQVSVDQDADDGGVKGRPALPPELTKEIRRFIRDNPDMGETNLNAFAVTACKWYLAKLRRDKFFKIVTATSSQGTLPEEWARLLAGERPDSPD